MGDMADSIEHMEGFLFAEEVVGTRAWETCWKCKGSGHGMTMSGDPDGPCWECNGDGVLRTRDANGRFLPNPKEPHQ